MVKRIGFILGSLRQESNSQKVAAAVKALFPEEVVITEIPIGDLPLYNPDLDEGNVPESYTRFRQAVKEQDGIVFITPEYNRGSPAAIKNAIDVGSRPIGQGVFDGKPSLIVSHSTGNVSGFGANHQLRQSLVFLNVPVLAQPEAYLAQADQLFDEQGNCQMKAQKDSCKRWLMLILVLPNVFEN